MTRPRAALRAALADLTPPPTSPPSAPSRLTWSPDGRLIRLWLWSVTGLDWRRA